MSMTRAQGTLQLSAEVTGVQYHPRMENIFVTSDSNGRVCLRDARMAFGPLNQRNNGGIVRTVSHHSLYLRLRAHLKASIIQNFRKSPSHTSPTRSLAVSFLIEKVR